MPTQPTLHVCTTCRAGRPQREGHPDAGQLMLEALQAAATQGVQVLPVKCLASCNDGCAAAISQPGKWTYVLGRLDPTLAPDLLAYAQTYALHPTGTVMPSKRPPSLDRMILARMPCLQPVQTLPGDAA